MAAANRLWLLTRSARRLTTEDLSEVQRRREWPERVTKVMQSCCSAGVINHAGVARGRLTQPRL